MVITIIIRKAMLAKMILRITILTILVVPHTTSSLGQSRDACSNGRMVRLHAFKHLGSCQTLNLDL